LIREPRRSKRRQTRWWWKLWIDNWRGGARWRLRRVRRRLPLLEHAIARDERRTPKVLRCVRRIPSVCVLPWSVSRPEWEYAANEVDYWWLLVHHVLDFHASGHRLRRRVTIRKLETQVRRDRFAVVDARFDVRTLALACRPIRNRQKWHGWGARRRKLRRWWALWRRRWLAWGAVNRPVRAHGPVIPFAVCDVALRPKVVSVRSLALVRKRVICFSRLRRRPEWRAVRAVCSQFAIKERRATPSVVALAIVREEEARIITPVGGRVTYQPVEPMSTRTRIVCRKLSATSTSRQRAHWSNDTRTHLTKIVVAQGVCSASPTVVVKRVTR